MSANKKVNIRPGVSVLSVLRHLNYSPWFALAEFVDNSLQSYIENKSKVHELHGPAWKLKVSIDVDTSHPGRITIRDNAAGIASDAFPRAFRPAVIPPDRTGLSEFGMGMKSAACWFAPKWQVRTKALGEAVERTVRFDIAMIVRDELEELEIDERPAGANDHFTEVALDEPHYVPVGRTLGKIKELRGSVRSRSFTLDALIPMANHWPKPMFRELDRCPPKASVKPAGAKSEEEGVLKCKGLRGLRVGVNSHAKSA